MRTPIMALWVAIVASGAVPAGDLGYESVAYRAWDEEIRVDFGSRRLVHTRTEYTYDNPVSATPSGSRRVTVADGSVAHGRLRVLAKLVGGSGFMDLPKDSGAPVEERHYPYRVEVVTETGRSHEVVHRSNPAYGEEPAAFRVLAKQLSELATATGREPADRVTSPGPRGGPSLPTAADPAALADRLAVIETMDRLFVSTDRKDWDGVRAAFSDQVYFDMTSLAGGEPGTVSADSIVEGWRKGLEAVPFVFHQSGNHFVTVSGDTAQHRCYGIAYHYRPDADKRVTTFVGSYETTMERRPNGWAISRFKYLKGFVE